MASSGDIPTPPSGTAYRWIPIRSLGPRHRPRIERHLLDLATQDRYLRFGYNASDERIHLYVRELNFERDELFGVFNRRLEMIAMAHLAFAPPTSGAAAPATAEFAVSVLGRSRGRGYGLRLFERAIMHARNRGISALIVHALGENTAMLRLARKAGATVQRFGGEAEAQLVLPPEDWGSRLEELVQTHAAELNYHFKAQARRLDGWLDLATDIRRQAADAAHRSSR